MSDEEVLGKTCFIPKRTWMFAITLGFLVYGVYNSLYFILFAYTQQGKMTPSHCSGIDRCTEILTCDATRKSSYHLRITVMTIGGLVFGITGTNAIFNKYASDTFNLACWLLFAVVFTIVTVLSDIGYLAICSSHYSYNIIAEAVMWPVPNLPVHGGVKYEVRHMDSYPSKYLDTLSGHSVFFLYILWSVIKIVFYSHAAWTCSVLAQRFHYGLAGMGANFSIEGWRKQLMMRYEISEVATHSLGLAAATGMDLDWREDEYLLSKTMAAPHWYRGAIPEAAARAYDGFRDDRRNVLL